MSSFAPITAYPALACAALPTASNVFMTFARYGHRKHRQFSRRWSTALISRAIALFEYLLQVPANRIRGTALSLPQFKILQDVIALIVLVPFRSCTRTRASGSTTSGRNGACPARPASSSVGRRAP